MACLCTDLLYDVGLKFDLIEELLNTILGLIQPPFVARLPGEAIGRGEGYIFRYDREEKRVKVIDRLKRALREDEEILAVIKAFLDLI